MADKIVDWDVKHQLEQTNILYIYMHVCLICLFNLILYVPVNNFSVMSGRFFLG